MDDLLDEMNSLCSSIVKKIEEQSTLLQEEDLQSFLTSVSSINTVDQHSVCITNLNKELEKKMAMCDAVLKERDNLKTTLLTEKDDIAQQLHLQKERQKESEKAYPRTRYSVNVYKDVSQIRWHTSAESNEISGVINRKSNAKSFKFDAFKQSQFFITNSLWDMESDKS